MERKKMMAGEYAVFQAQSQRPASVAMPRCDARGKAVLDIGCGTGKDLLSEYYEGAKMRCGVDIDANLIGYGRANYPMLRLEESPAEKLPFPCGHFEIVVARVALPYTDIPKALAEIYRVTKPGGHLYLTMHDWRWHMAFVVRALKDRSVKRLVDLAYVTWASWVYLLTGAVPEKPWNGKRETYQTRWRFQRSLEQAGFTEVLSGRTPRHWIIQAIKPHAGSAERL